MHLTPRRRSRPAMDRLEDRLAPASVVWTGTRPTGLGTDWFVASNWEVVGSNPIVNAVPGPGDDAVVAGPSPAIAINGTASVRSLSFDRGAGLDVNGSLALGPGSSSWTTVRLNGTSTLDIGEGATIGTAFFPCAVAGTGSITNPGGRMFTVIRANWSVPYTNQGTTASHGLALTGPITAAPGSVFRVIGIGGTGPGSLSAASFTNQGTIELTSVNGVASATFGVRNGATFTHAAGALIAARVGTGDGGRVIVADTGASLFTAGDWLVEPGVTLTVNVGVPFTWQGGGVSGGGILDLPNTTVAAGATLDAPADATLALGANTVSGAGTFRVLAGRAQTFGNTTVSAAFVNQGLTVLTSTTLSGTVTNAAGAVLRLVETGNPGNMTTSAFVNAGRIELTSPGRAWSVTSGGTLVNGPTGVIDITGVGHTINAFGGGGFLNQGSVNVPVNAVISINAGTLTNAGLITISGGATLGGSATLANAVGGTLTGNGTFGRAVTNDGTVRPGLAGPGILGTSNYTQSATGTLAVDLFGPAAGTQYDQLRTPDFTVVTLAGTLAINPASTPAVGTVFTIIDNGGRAAVSGTFAGLPQNGTVTVGGTTYRISYVGGDGNDVTLTVVPPAVPARVSNTQINDGSAQRSRVTSLTVTFSTQVTFAGAVGNAFTLVRVSDSAPVNFTAATNVVGGVTVVTLNNFTGAAAESLSLADGRYRLTALAAQITANGFLLDGNGDGTGGDDFVRADGGTAGGVFRYYGDTNGDRVVDGLDFFALRSTFNLNSTQAGYLAYVDFNGDGVVDGLDFFQFRSRFNTTVP